jgi:hypothetical protein
MGKKILVRAMLGLVLAVAAGTSYANSQDEVDKQISKLIGDAVSARVSSKVLDSAFTQSGSAKTEPNNVWASYTRINVDFSTAGAAAGTPNSFHTNAYVAGYDRDLTDNLVAGAAVSYSSTDNSGGTSWGIQPYLSYLFSNSVFGIIKGGYTRSDFDSNVAFPGGSQISNSKTDSYSWGVSLNGLYKAGDWAAKGRVEVGSSRSDTSTTSVLSCTPAILNFCPSTSATSSSSGSTSYIGDGELDYYFSQGFYGFAGVQLSDTNKSNSYASYGRIGLEKEISKGAAISAKYEGKINDNQPSGTNFKVNTFTIAIRARF